MQNDVIEKYYVLRAKVQEQAPDQWAEVIDLCNSVPKEISTDTFWTFGKDKPCWSNINVKIGERLVRDLHSSSEFESFHTIGGDAWRIDMKQEGRKWQSNQNFTLTGESARHFMESLSPRGLASFRWRLYAIRQFALSLFSEKGTLPMITALSADPSTIVSKDLYSWTKIFATRAGRGWGATTVNHLLTDLGLSVKPDLHLRRSAVRLGILDDILVDTPTKEIDKLGYKLDSKIVHRLLDLSKLISPIANPSPRTTLREMDKVLMELSRQGLMSDDF
jgi:hypothetical protein